MKHFFLKNTLLTCWGLLIGASLGAQSFYYYDTEGQKRVLTPEAGKFSVTFEHGMAPDSARVFLTKTLPGSASFQYLAPVHTALVTMPACSIETLRTLLFSAPQVQTVMPLCLTADGETIIPTNTVIAMAPGVEQSADLEERAAELGLSLSERIGFGPATAPVLVWEVPRGGNAIDMGNLLYESGLAVFAQADFSFPGHNDNLPDDPLFADQWFLHQANDIDIDAPEAWELTNGSSTVVVAVLDGSGYDMNHPDLQSKFIDPYDAVNDDSVPEPENEFANHGTPCAGLIGAATNNGLGVSGTGYNVMVMPVAIGFNANATGGFTTNLTIIARAASHVIAHPNVVAVSNSYSTGSSNSISYRLMQKNTRGGLGAVILNSTANSGSSNTPNQPAKQKSVLGVGNSNKSDQRNVSSNYGQSLDVMAPGTRTLTTDRSGADGYSDGDYHPAFTGTSASCPITAGVVGLMASANPQLPGFALEEILQSTTDKVGGYPYAQVPNRPYGTWQHEMGYGRINAYSAVLKAMNYGLALADTMVLNPVEAVAGQLFEVDVQLRNFSLSSAFSGDVNLVIRSVYGDSLMSLGGQSNVSLCANCALSNPLHFSATPGLPAGFYLLELRYRTPGGSWQRVHDGGAQNDQQFELLSNLPDPYENNDTESAAYVFSPVFVNGIARVTTEGANFHTETDEDYFKIILPPGSQYIVHSWVQHFYSGTSPYTAGANVSLNRDTGWTSPAFPFYSDTLVFQNGGTLMFHLNGNNWNNSLMGSYQLGLVITNSQIASTPGDQYEANNTPETAYPLTADFIDNIARIQTPGATIHRFEDLDYYKVTLPPGNFYSINGKVHDLFSSTDGSTYTGDVVWSCTSYVGQDTQYSGGQTDGYMGDPLVVNDTGGVVLLRVQRYVFARNNNLGSYNLDVTITRIVFDSSSVSVQHLPEQMTLKSQGFPQPASEQFTLLFSINKPATASLRVFDLSGRLIWKRAGETLSDTQTTAVQIPTAGWSSGIYYWNLLTDQGVASGKIIVQQ